MLVFTFGDHILHLHFTVAAHVKDIVRDTKCLLLLLEFILILLVYLSNQFHVDVVIAVSVHATLAFNFRALIALLALFVVALALFV